MESKLLLGIALSFSLAQVTPPKGATTVPTHQPGYRGSSYVFTVWDKRADKEFLPGREKLDSLWIIYRAGDPEGVLAKEYQRALNRWQAKRSLINLHLAMGVGALATLLTDRKPRFELQNEWQSCRQSKSLELARSVYLYLGVREIDQTPSRPIARVILNRDPKDELVLMRYCRDTALYAPKEARGILPLVRPYLKAAYNDPLWASSAASAYISSSPKTPEERYKYGLIAYQLLKRYEVLTGKTTLMGSKQLQINYHKIYPKDKPFDSNPWVIGPGIR